MLDDSPDRKFSAKITCVSAQHLTKATYHWLVKTTKKPNLWVTDTPHGFLFLTDEKFWFEAPDELWAIRSRVERYGSDFFLIGVGELSAFKCAFALFNDLPVYREELR